MIDVKLSDEDIERIARRVAVLLAQKFAARPTLDEKPLAKKALPRSEVQPSEADIAEVAARRARRGYP